MYSKKCVNCDITYDAKRSTSVYCSQKCGASYRWKLTPKDTDKPRVCPECGNTFYATPIANHKKTCSPECRTKRNSRITREFHLRNPERESIYRQRTRDKQLPDSNNIRFYRAYPNAPRFCESCGESRVLDIAHKPGHERNGAYRNRDNCKWPEKVWVLCPTCHALHDRMNYSYQELGLKL